MSAGPTMRGVVTVEESLSVFPFHFFSRSRRNVSREFLEEDSEPLSWRGNEGRVEHTPTIRRYNIILYTREKRKRREKGEKKRKEIEDSVEKLNNQAVCSREGRFITINTFALMEDSSQYKFESRVEGEKKKKEKRKMPFYRVSNFYVFQTSSGGVGVDRWIRDIERERLRWRGGFGSQHHGRCEEYVTRNWIWKFVRLSDRFRLRDLARKTVGFTSIPYLCDVARTWSIFNPFLYN